MELPERKQLQAMYRPVEIEATAYAKLMLIKAIKQGSSKQHIYIYAPARFGKTVAVLHLANETPGGKAWIALNEEDNFSDVFFMRLALAFLSAQPDNTALAGRLCAVKEYDSFPNLAEDAVYCLCPGAIKTWIILDSFENIKGEGLIRSLVKVIKALPAGFTVMIIGRQEPHELFSDLILRNLMSVIKEDSVIL